MSIKNELIEEFNDEVKGLRGLQLGSDEYKATVDGVTKLADRIIEIDKIQQEASAKQISQINENELKAAQMADDRIDKWIRNGIEGVKVVGGLVAAGLALVVSINFEREGTLTTEAGKSALRQLLKFK